MKFVKILIISFFISTLVGPVSAAEVSKIAYINAIEVVNNYYKTIDADGKLEEEGKKKSAERDKIVNKINKIRDEVELLSKEAREKKEAELNEQMRILQDFDREARLSLKRKSDDMRREILKEIDEVIRDYGKKNSYNIIFDDRVLLYADESIDITGEILKILNKGR